MKQISLALLGFGNVGQAFASLLLNKREMIVEKFQIDFIVTGIFTGRHGYAINYSGINLTRALELIKLGIDLKTISDFQSENMDVENFIYSCSAEFLLESTPLNPFDGQPALSYVKNALNSGKHVVTANKGPVVYGYKELMKISEQVGKAFYFESSVMDGAPIFSLFRDALPAIHILGANGILNSCTNYLLDLMFEGMPFELAINQAKAIGIAETDPGTDIDGWDASVKLSAISTVLLGIPLTPHQIDRTGIRSITPEMIAKARSEGKKWKLVCSLKRKDQNLLYAIVKPEKVDSSSPLYNINGTSSYIQFETDVLPGLGIVETSPGPQTTAYGMLADVLNIIKKFR